MKPIAARIDKAFPPGGSIVGNRLYVRAVNAFCPFCGQRGTFVLGDLFSTKHPQIRPTSGRCPTCDKVAIFTFFYEQDPDKQEVSSVTVFPSNETQSDAIEIPETLSENLRRAIRDAEQCYFAGLYSPALTSAGRALEGILKYLSSSGDSKRTLNDLLKEFSESKDAAAPILALSHSIRKARNVGAHFDDYISADRETATIMLDLLRYCIAYFFLFAEEARKLESILEIKNKAADVLR